MQGKKGRKGYLDCGCKEEVALMDFYFWKTWTLPGVIIKGKGENKVKVNITDTMMSHRLGPRERAFVIEAFKKATLLTIDDLYSKGDWKGDTEERVLTLQLNRLVSKINEKRALKGKALLFWDEEGVAGNVSKQAKAPDNALTDAEVQYFAS
jgi:hypothetical protein